MFRSDVDMSEWAYSYIRFSLRIVARAKFAQARVRSARYNMFCEPRSRFEAMYHLLASASIEEEHLAAECCSSLSVYLPD